jgi:hypothetical protein
MLQVELAPTLLINCHFRWGIRNIGARRIDVRMASRDMPDVHGSILMQQEQT